MFSFLKKQKEETTKCVVVITGASVMGSIVRTYLRQGAVTEPIVLFSCEREISAQYGDSREVIDTLAGEALTYVLNQCRSAYGSCDDMVCVVGEPWVTIQNRSLSIQKNGPFVVTEKMVQEAIDRDIRLMYQELEREQDSDISLKIIDTTQPIVFVNGYKTPIWQNQKVEQVTITTTVSLIPDALQELIRTKVAYAFHREDVQYKSLISSIPKRFSTNNQEQTVLIIGGSQLLFVNIHQGVITGSGIYPGGFLDVIRMITMFFETSQDRMGMITQFASDEKIMQSSKDSYYQRLVSAYEELGHYIGLAKHASQKKGLVHSDTVVILTHAPWMHLFTALLEKDLGKTVVFPEMNTAPLVYTHDASCQNILLTLAILETV